LAEVRSAASELCARFLHHRKLLFGDRTSGALRDTITISHCHDHRLFAIEVSLSLSGCTPITADFSQRKFSARTPRQKIAT
jgi:hypothetical protein